jgi:hypothetical protein
MRTNLRDTSQAAVRLKVKKRRLESWRQIGQGPRYIKVGRSVRYADEDLDEFIRSNRRNSTSPDDQTLVEHVR